jgi:hypothetical protein
MKIARLANHRLCLSLLVTAGMISAAVAQEPRAKNGGVDQSQQPAQKQDAGVTSQTAQSPPGAHPLPDSPGAAQSLAAGEEQSRSEGRQTVPSALTAPQPNGAANQPVGTAAAESVTTTGVAVSRPAGLALAPAKQRRVRSMLIKVGVVVGAGAAIGTTLALTKASPGRPPGAH